MLGYIFGLIFFSFAGALVFTPFIFTGLTFMMGEVGWPFSRVFDRAAMLCAVIYIWFYRKQLSLHEVRELLARQSKAVAIKHLIIGFLITSISSGILLTSIVGDGEIIWEKINLTNLILKFLKVLPAAFLISILEESLFRGLILRTLNSKFIFPLAALLSSIIYAAVHFIAPVKDFKYLSFSPLAGIAYSGAVIERILAPGVADAAIGLVLVGLALCVAVRCTGSLWYCIGMHSGWVMVMKLSNVITTSAPGFEFASGIGERYFLVAHLTGWIAIILAAQVAPLFMRNPKLTIASH